MSTLLHPIHGTRDKCRPKHQVLVLKCYPKYQKTVQEIKPNSSELSYLLYYASARRSKLQKVGSFLEKKTASDVWRGKLGNVQVTLQILTAVIEKVPRDLSLYSRSILTILDSVLRSKDINMVEESIPTFEAYCKHADESSLTADQSRAQQYLNIVELYSSFATKNQSSPTKSDDSVPIALRWRTAGLRAIRAIVGSDALASESAKQLTITIPVVLDNLSLEKNNVFNSLHQRVTTSEKQDIETARRRRMSVATVATVDTTDANPLSAAETTADADRLAEEEVRILAVRCLKQIFSIGVGSARGQIRLATALTLKFIAAQNPPRESAEGVQQGNWATSLFETIARWTPVQDRFIIVVTAMETLIRSPVVESVLEKQLVLATMIDWLLSSSINLIGLSVMDILLGLINHTLFLLQLGGRDSRFTAQHEQAVGLRLFHDAKDSIDPTLLLQPEHEKETIANEVSPSPVRQELLFRLQKCIASLSNHIYYTDQITDMMTAILARLKPSPQSDITIMAAINDPSSVTKAIADSVSLQEDPSTDSFFSFATARVVGLRAVKDILIRANNRRTTAGASIEARARVGIQVWDGTQWLLKDEDRNVRMAYVDALLTWLKLETNRNDSLLPKDGPRKPRVSKKNANQNGDMTMSKRAVSNASRKEPKAARSTFLQLLHLAIFDSVFDGNSNQVDVLMLYLLLTKLVERLGVNAIRVGLPMVTNIQEMSLNTNGGLAAETKVCVASLVHGYLWTIAEKFDFEAGKAGNEINAEISRRKRFSVWFEKIKFPALSIDQISTIPVQSEKASLYPQEAIGTIKPFLNFTDMVEEIANAYDSALVTPPTSAPSSPGRVFSVPTLGFGYGYGVAPVPRPSPEDQLPQKVKDEMTSNWTRESCAAALEKESAGSVTGSRTAASSMPHQHLQVNGLHKTESNSGRESPTVANADAGPGYGLFGGLGNLQKQRQGSNNGSPVPLTATSSRDSTLRVTELKRALSGYNSAVRQASPLRKPTVSSRQNSQSTGSESMTSWTEIDKSGIPVGDVSSTRDRDGQTQDSRGKQAQLPSTSQSQNGRYDVTNEAHPQEHTRLGNYASDARFRDDVPPVPKIPSTLNLPGTWPRDSSPVREPVGSGERSKVRGEQSTVSPRYQSITGSTKDASSAREGRKTNRNSRPTSRMGGSSIWSDSHSNPAEKLDLGSLLAGIRSSNEDVDRAQDSANVRLSRPPY